MQRCGSQYGIFQDGRWTWFTTCTEAATAEAAELRQKVERKRASGGTVILTKEMYRQMETVQRSAPDTALNQNAD